MSPQVSISVYNSQTNQLVLGPSSLTIPSGQTSEQFDLPSGVPSGSYYATVGYQVNGASYTTQTSTMQVSPAAGSRRNVGVIIGAVVGGVVALIITILVCVYVRRARARRASVAMDPSAAKGMVHLQPIQVPPHYQKHHDEQMAKQEPV